MKESILEVIERISKNHPKFTASNRFSREELHERKNSDSEDQSKVKETPLKKTNDHPG